MSEEEEQRKRPEFRVVDKRISARGDSPPASPAPADELPGTEPAPSPAAPEPQSPQQPAPPQAASPPQEATPAGPEGDPIWTPEQEAEAQRFIQEIGQRPSLDWVLNTAVTLANVAGTKLDLGQVADAQVAIDALAALVDKLGSRFGQAEAPLRQTLAQLQLAYAERNLTAPSGPQGPAPTI